MTEVDRLRVVYELQDQQYRAGIQRMRNATRATSDQIVAQAKRAEAGLAGIGRAFAGAFSAAVLVGVSQRLTRIADAATQMQNSLRVVGLEGAELSRVYDQLFRSAQRNSAPISSLVDLYSKLALTQKELGVTGDELIRFTDGIAVALKVAGTDATAASGSLLQLSQALGGGVVRAEEFNSMLEGTPTIVQAVARGLKEANGSVAELRKLVNEGKVSSTAYFRAFEVGSEELRRQAETSQTTVGQAFTQLGNSLVTVVGEFDKATGASGQFAQGLSNLANGIDSFDAEGFISKIQRIADAIRDADEAGTAWLNSIGNSDFFKSDTDAEEWFNRVTNPDVGEAQDKINLLEREIETLQAAIENDTRLGFDNSEALSRLAEVRAELAAVRAEAAALPSYFPGANMMNTGTFIGLDGYTPPPSAPSVEPVSIADHPAAPSKGGSRGRKRGGSGGRSRKEQLDDYAKEVKAIRERTAALETEAASLLLVAASGEDYGDALEYARKRAELLHAAQKAGKQITPELSAEIDQLAQSYVTAGLNAEQAAEKLDQIKGATERGKNALEDMFGSIIDGSASAKDAVASLLAEIAKAQVIKGIMALPGMGSLSNAIGGLLSFDGGGFTGHGSRSGGIDGRGGFPAILHPNETVIDHTRGQGGIAPKITINNNAPGATVSADYVTRDEVILTVSQAIASSNRRQSDKKYLAMGVR